MTKRKISLSIGILLVLLAGGVFATPRINWVPTALTPDSIAPGEIVTLHVTLSNSGQRTIPDTNHLQVIAGGDIVPYVSVGQPTFPHAWKHGASVSVPVTVSVPMDMPLSVMQGTLRLVRVSEDEAHQLETNHRPWHFSELPVELTFSTIPLPPDPGPENDETLLGIDSEENGVRDDIDRYIVFTYPDSAKIREALKQEARELSLFLRDSESKELSRAHALAEGSLSCLLYVYGGYYGMDIETFDVYDQTESLLRAQFLNTRERSRAYDRADYWLGGMVFPDTKSSELKNKCTFDPDILPN